MTDREKLEKLRKALSLKQKNIDPKITAAINDNFWDLFDETAVLAEIEKEEL